ncbi:MAG: hypothetical protein NVS2B14_00560 [Chamaesiphon sp.]
MNFSDYFEEFEEADGYCGWSNKEDYPTWANRVRQLRNELRGDRPDRIIDTVRENVIEEKPRLGVSRGQGRVEYKPSKRILHVSEQDLFE